MSPKVSCIIIFLNYGKYISEAIESVLSQTYVDWELILVDDGSTDEATAIARRYASDHPGKVFYTEHHGHENRGMSASRNAGLAMARGEFVAFLDADDIWLPNRLQRHMEVMDAHPEVAATISPTVLWSSWNKPTVSRFRPWRRMDLRYDLQIPYGTVLEPPFLVQHDLATRGSGVPGICSVLVRTEILRGIGGFKEEFRRLYEDQVMFFKLFLEHRVIGIDEMLDFYRQHSESACYVDNLNHGDVKMRPLFLNWLEEYIKSRNVTDPDLWEALRREQERFIHPIAYISKNPIRSFVGTWKSETRKAAVWLLTPRGYNWVRERLGMKRTNVYFVPDKDLET